MKIDPCTEYGLSLAIQDFVPVLLAGAGAIALANACGRRHPSLRVPALVGAALVTTGGLSKAVWKTLVAAEPCRNIEILEQILFPCLAFGFALLAWAVVSLRKDQVVSPVPYAVVPVLGVASALYAGAMGPLLGVAALGAVWMGLNLAGHARALGMPAIAGLFIAYLLGTLILPPLAARPDQSERLQWIEQGTNSLVQLCFLIGVVAILRHSRTADPLDSSPQPAGVHS
ncbi:hypothetical protein [Nocardioides sp.]|uniref:hypothetical protein n=1 Tax=Nocardioides sp. TaxID=35761 RepID=UPI0035650000